MKKSITAFNAESAEKSIENAETSRARILSFSAPSASLRSLRRKSLVLLATLLAFCLPASAVQLQGGKPLARGEESLRPDRAVSPEGAVLHGVVGAIEVDVGVVTINGLRFSVVGVPLHGARGDMTLKELPVGSRVRVALGGPPNQRRVLALWVLQ